MGRLPARYHKFLTNRFVEEEHLPKGQKVVIVCPHPDDGGISAGSTAHLLAKHGNEVHIIYFTNGDLAKIEGIDSREEVARVRFGEGQEEARRLGAVMHWIGESELGDRKAYTTKSKSDFRKLMKEINPSMVFLPNRFDTGHGDHREVGKLTNEILKEMVLKTGSPIVRSEMESPWGILPGSHMNTVVRVTPPSFKAKRRALGAHPSQTTRTPFDDVVVALNKIRGVYAGEVSAGFGEKPRPYHGAEAFHVSLLSRESGKLKIIEKQNI